MIREAMSAAAVKRYSEISASDISRIESADELAIRRTLIDASVFAR